MSTSMLINIINVFGKFIDNDLRFAIATSGNRLTQIELISFNISGGIHTKGVHELMGKGGREGVIGAVVG